MHELVSLNALPNTIYKITSTSREAADGNSVPSADSAMHLAFAV
jgi:hypothetical protein